MTEDGTPFLAKQQGIAGQLLHHAPVAAAELQHRLARPNPAGDAFDIRVEVLPDARRRDLLAPAQTFSEKSFAVVLSHTSSATWLFPRM